MHCQLDCHSRSSVGQVLEMRTWGLMSRLKLECPVECWTSVVQRRNVAPLPLISTPRSHDSPVSLVSKSSKALRNEYRRRGGRSTGDPARGGAQPCLLPHTPTTFCLLPHTPTSTAPTCRLVPLPHADESRAAVTQRDSPPPTDRSMFTVQCSKRQAHVTEAQSGGFLADHNAAFPRRRPNCCSPA